MLVLPVAFILITLVSVNESAIKMTNVKCTDYEPGFATFTNCRLKVVKRGVVALSLHVKLLQTPVNNVTFNLSLHKKFSGYRPFLYNTTVDFCHYQRNQRKYLFAKIILDMLLDFSNINHTCPYDVCIINIDHDIILQNLIVDENMFKLLPLPMGDYMFQFKVGAYNDWKADVKVYATFQLSYTD